MRLIESTAPTPTPTRFTFNNGRNYTPEGQIITVILLDDNRILLVDHTRGIDYATAQPIPEYIPFQFSPGFKSWLMAQYDSPAGHTSTWTHSPETYKTARETKRPKPLTE